MMEKARAVVDSLAVKQRDFLQEIKSLPDPVCENPILKRAEKRVPESLWYKLFTMYITVTVDPLFLYITIINQDDKCLEMNKKLWTGSFVYRLFLDFIPLVCLLYRCYFFICRRTTVSAALITYVSINVLALLPIPQLLMRVAFYKIWGSGSFRLLIIIYWILAQYLPKIYRIRQDFKRIKNNGISLKATTYISFYILSGYVVGAIWYFSSIGRAISCWHSACVNHNTDPKRCIDAFYCDRQSIASRNITSLNEHCSLDISDGASSLPFNFGIYLDALNTGIVGHVKISTKVTYCFWWGLRNISNFGTNLMTSTYEWENWFAIYISIFSYILITVVAATALPQAPVSEQRRRKILMNRKSWNISGDDLPVPDDLEKEILSNIDKKVEENEDADLKNDIFSILPAETRERLQRFVCMEILRTGPHRESTDHVFKYSDLKAPVSEQRRRKFLMENLKSWNISGHDLPADLEIEILSSIHKKVEENEDADLKNDIFSILPAKTREPLQRFLCMEILKTVPVLKMMGTQALEKICDNLKPVTYKENSFIFRMGDPLDCMLFIIKGTVCTYSWTSSTSATSSKMAARLLGEGQFYGEDLLNSPDFTQLPISTEHVKTRGKVQALALMADDLATVVANNCANNNCEEVEDDIVEIKVLKVARR